VPPVAATSNAALSGKKFSSGGNNVNKHAKMYDYLFFLVIHPKNENFTLRIVPPPLPPPFALCRP